MESPTPLCEVNLKRYKGIRASKKPSSVYSDQQSHKGEKSTINLQGQDDDCEVLGPRSLSLTALAELPEGQKRSSSSASVIEVTRMAQLESLEAKMANIEVSLSNLNGGLNGTGGQSITCGGAGRRKRNGLVSGTSRSVYSSSVCGGRGENTTTISVNSGSTSHSIMREFHKEMELLRQNMKDKENLIHNLQGQLRKLSKKKMTHGSITSTDSGVVSLRILTENERKGAEERLSQLDKDMEVKRSEIKRINHLLERLDPSDNIDVRIQQAELEYELEREELNLMNLQEERRNLHTILDDNDAFQRKTENSLFATIPANGHLSIHSFEVSYEAHDPSFSVGKRENKQGTFVTWTRDNLKTLKRGDRIIEINGTMVISKGVNRVEEFWIDEMSQNSDQQPPQEEILAALAEDIGSHPLKIVILRAPPPPPPPRVPNKELQALKEELALVTAKLEEVNGEKRDLHSIYQKVQKDHQMWENESERSRLDTDKIAKERDILRTESVRLKHRISYLEEQVTELLQRKELLNGSHPVTVFQKGNHKAIVSDQVQSNNKKSHRSSSPNRSSSVASTRTGSEHRLALKTRLWETFRRATSGDSRSVCSIDSSSKRLSENGYFKKRSSELSSKQQKKHQQYLLEQQQQQLQQLQIDCPPTKPIRLSLQRATSTCNVYSSGIGGSICGGNEIPEMNPGLKRSNYSENTLVPTDCNNWSTNQLHHHHNHMMMQQQHQDDILSEQNYSSEKKQKSSKSHGIRWPSLRPASSMSYTMGLGKRNSSNNIAKF